MELIEKNIIGLLVEHGVFIKPQFVYEVEPNFTENIIRNGCNGDTDSTFKPSCIVYDTLTKQLNVTFSNVDDNRDITHIPFSALTTKEQAILWEMVNFLVETE